MRLQSMRAHLVASNIAPRTLHRCQMRSPFAHTHTTRLSLRRMSKTQHGLPASLDSLRALRVCSPATATPCVRRQLRLCYACVRLRFARNTPRLPPYFPPSPPDQRMTIRVSLGSSMATSTTKLNIYIEFSFELRYIQRVGESRMWRATSDRPLDAGPLQKLNGGRREGGEDAGRRTTKQWVWTLLSRRPHSRTELLSPGQRRPY
jgi:hypothetical protein